MRHGMANKKLNRTSEHRKALLKNMLNSLIKYEQIKTTLPKAKFLKPQADKIITLGKKETLQTTKMLVSQLQDIKSANKVKKTLSKRYEKRNGGYTGFVKEGGNLDETYAINVFLFEIPNFDSQDTFIDFVKAGREQDFDPKRFKIIKDDITSFEGREDYCASYHSVAEDKEAVKRSRNKEMMILEMAGYICRHPKNKNIGINFDYSHRYYSNNKDSALLDKSNKAFNKFEF